MINDTKISHEHSLMVRHLSKPGAEIIAQLTPHIMHIFHMAVGLAGETAELALASHAVCKGQEEEEQAQQNIIEELGDIEFYFIGLQQGLGIKLKDDSKDERFGRLVHGRIVHNRSEKLLSMEWITSLHICSGNILDKAKRLAIYNKPMQKEQPELILLMREFRTLLSYLYEDLTDENITCEKAKAHNINKLLKGENARYKSGRYTNEQANNRADKA